MELEWVREYCMSMAHATESIEWGEDLVFKVGGKIFAVMVLEPAKVWLSFKCTLEEFAELTERAGIIPAPYLARHHWVALETREALSATELESLLRTSYHLVFEKLPRKTRAELASGKKPSVKSRHRHRSRRTAR